MKSGGVSHLRDRVGSIKKHILGRVYYTEYKLRVFAYCWGMKDVVAIYWKLREERRSKGNFTEEIGVEQIVKMY